jgi:RNA polymerase sigma factor (sigma-70 family)
VLGNKFHAYTLFIRKLNTPVTTAASLSPQALFLQHEGWLRTVVRSRLQEADAVEDVMQNIALAIVRQRSLLADVNRIGAWLYQIAIRQVLMYRRTTGRRRKLHDRLQQQSPEVTDIAEPLQVLLHEETREKVRQALLQLSELDRQVLMLKYSEGWTYREIADHLGVQEDTIEYRLMRARKSLRQHLRTFAEGR